VPHIITVKHELGEGSEKMATVYFKLIFQRFIGGIMENNEKLQT
jgi:hypothetical protein